MKNQLRFPQLLKICFPALAAAMWVTGCQDIKDITQIKPFEGITYKLKYQPAKTQVQGLVVDARTGVPLQAPITVSITGKDASRAITFDGKAVTNYTHPTGDIFIGLKGASPTAGSPAELRVVVEANGYVASSANLRLMKERNDPFTIRLVKQDSPPPGVAAKVEATAATSTGTITSEKQISVATVPTNSTATGTQVAVTLPANTILKDDKGQPVTGNIQASVVAFSGQSNEARAAFPGGQVQTVAKAPDGQTNVTTVLNPVGFVAINLTNTSGQSVATFSQPIIVRASVPASTFNEKTKRTIAVGDAMSVFSYNEDIGIWTFERDVTVDLQGGQLGINIPVTHLSYYSWVTVVPLTSSTCQATFGINNLPQGFSYRYVLNREGVFFSSGSSNNASFTLTLDQAKYDLIVIGPSGDVVASASLTNPCGNIPVNATPPANTVNARFTVRATCENGKNIEIYPDATVYYRPEGSTGDPASASFSGGVGTLTGLKANTNYVATVYYEGTYSETFNSGTTNSDRTLTYVLKSNTQVCK